MPINMPCTDCGKHGDATCHLLSFEDEPWLCRGCTDKRVKKLHHQIKSWEKRCENVENNLHERIENWIKLDNQRLARIEELEESLEWHKQLQESQKGKALLHL